MELNYPNKKSVEDILNISPKIYFDKNKKIDLNSNLLINSDNIFALKTLLDDFNLRGKIDLIYIDPPFATNSTFSIGDDRVSTVSRSREDKTAYEDKLLGHEFLEFLRLRLVLLRELLSDNGSIYVHTDYKIGHYVKVIMDEIFGIKNFRNDITRIKCNPKNFSRKAYGNIKDLILFYSKTSSIIWNEPADPLNEKDVLKLYKKVDSNGRRYTTIPLHAPGESKGNTGSAWRNMYPPKGRHWRTDPLILEEWDSKNLIEWSKNGNPRKIIYADERSGKKKQDIWEYKDSPYPIYPTEKNINLLMDIVSASSDKNSIVLDCFCGSGTTLVASSLLDRKWIGIDNSEHSIEVVRKRFEEPSLKINNKYNFLTASDLKTL